MRCGERSPIALLLCCSAGGFDQPEDCLAEELLRAEQGPVAALAGSHVTMPYAMSVLGADDYCAFFFQEDCATAGDLLKEAKRAMMLRPRDNAQSKAVDALAQVLNPASNDLAMERAEHPGPVQLDRRPAAEATNARHGYGRRAAPASPGETIDITGTSPVDGTAEIELVVPATA